MRVLILGTTALVLSAGAASAQGVYVAPGYGYSPYSYGYAVPAPLHDYAAPAYGYAAPAYSYDYIPPAAWARGYWGRRSYGWQLIVFGRKRRELAED